MVAPNEFMVQTLDLATQKTTESPTPETTESVVSPKTIEIRGKKYEIKTEVNRRRNYHYSLDFDEILSQEQDPVKKKDLKNEVLFALIKWVDQERVDRHKEDPNLILGVKILDVDFEEQNFEELDFSNSVLVNVGFVGCNLKSANFSKSELGVDFTDSVLSRANFHWSVGLGFCTWTRAQIDYIQLADYPNMIVLAEGGRVVTEMIDGEKNVVSDDDLPGCLSKFQFLIYGGADTGQDEELRGWIMGDTNLVVYTIEGSEYSKDQLIPLVNKVLADLNNDDEFIEWYKLYHGDQRIQNYENPSLILANKILELNYFRNIIDQLQDNKTLERSQVNMIAAYLKYGAGQRFAKSTETRGYTPEDTTDTETDPTLENKCLQVLKASQTPENKENKRYYLDAFIDIFENSNDPFADISILQYHIGLIDKGKIHLLKTLDTTNPEELKFLNKVCNAYIAYETFKQSPLDAFQSVGLTSPGKILTPDGCFQVSYEITNDPERPINYIKLTDNQANYQVIVANEFFTNMVFGIYTVTSEATTAFPSASSGEAPLVVDKVQKIN